MSLNVLCPLCGQPHESEMVRMGGWEFRLIPCPQARGNWSLNLPAQSLTENHDPGDEDANR